MASRSPPVQCPTLRCASPIRIPFSQDYEALCKKLKEVSALSGISGLLVR